MSDAAYIAIGVLIALPFAPTVYRWTYRWTTRNLDERWPQ